MAYKQIATMSPISGKGDCPFDCVGCEHLLDMIFRGNDDIRIKCDLNDNEDEIIGI